MARRPRRARLAGLSDDCRRQIDELGVEVREHEDMYVVEGEHVLSAEGVEFYMSAFNSGWGHGVVARDRGWDNATEYVQLFEEAEAGDSREPPVLRTRRYAFALEERAAERVNRAFMAAERLLGRNDPNAALEIICGDWLSGLDEGSGGIDESELVRGSGQRRRALDL